MSDGDPKYEPVYRAAKAGDTKLVLKLVTDDKSLLNITDSNINCPLIKALGKEQIETAKVLIELGANVFVMNHSDDWPVKMIVRRDGLKAADRNQLVEAMILAGVCEQPIFHAIWRRDSKAVKAILESDPSQGSIRLADPTGDRGFYNDLPYCGLTPLHYAVIAGDLRSVRALLDGGADPDALPHGAKADSCHTPLMYVPKRCNAIAQLLIDHGADVRRDSAYITSGSKALREVAVANGAAGSPFMTAIVLKQTQEAIQLAKNDPNVIHERLEGAYCDTPLHLALKCNSAELIRVLVQQGMNVNLETSEGYTALEMASEQYCSYEVFRALVEFGGDIHAGGDAPLSNAIWQHAYRHWDYEKVIRYLVGKGCRIEGLYHCAIAGNLPATKLLIELGADVNDTRDDGWPGEGKGYTPLDYCTGVVGKTEHKKLAQYLQDNGGKHRSELQAK